mmetsp:Transcript_21649/g.51137  ORF Transcript_21649/g.51137 Transcript_21649/m.51137 type:complete len:411 (+) Transcript_21649:243-1475(+)
MMMMVQPRRKQLKGSSSLGRLVVVAAVIATNCLLVLLSGQGTGVVIGVTTSNSVLFAEARVWQTIVDHNIVRRSTTETLRYSLVIEIDPFLFPGDEEADEIPEGEDPSKDVWVTLAPTIAPSMVPSDAPSLVPTVWDIDRNGGCRQGQQLFEVHMYDSWGDGWDENTYVTISGLSDQDPNIEIPSSASMQRSITNEDKFSKVKIFRTIDLQDQKNVFEPTSATEINPLGTPIFMGNLKRGSHEVGQVCLVPKRCYQVTVRGGDFLNEVSWDIRKVDLEARYGEDPTLEEELASPAVGGGAPMNCTMSLPDEYGHHFCANECSPIEGETVGDIKVKESAILEHLQPADGVSSSNEHTSTNSGNEMAKSFGTKRTQPMNEKWTGIRGDGYGLGSFSILRNFKQHEEDEGETG